MYLAFETSDLAVLTIEEHKGSASPIRLYGGEVPEERRRKSTGPLPTRQY